MSSTGHTSPCEKDVVISVLQIIVLSVNLRAVSMQKQNLKSHILKAFDIELRSHKYVAFPEHKEGQIDSFLLLESLMGVIDGGNWNAD